MEWNFNKQYYSNFDWTQEPAESIQELYRRRAQDIRDRYDYVVIWYSGGPDSWNILNTFLKNDIKIDEIAHFMGYDGDKDKRSALNEEIFYTAIPTTQKILEQYPDIRHRVVDLSHIYPDLFSRPDIATEFLYSIKAVASANSFARSYMREYVKDYKDIINSGKRMCFIWGTEKPRLLHLNGKFHAMFLDFPSETHSRLQGLDSTGYFDEWFYWAPETAHMVAKQCHMIMKLYKNETADSHYMTNRATHYVCASPTTGKFLNKDIYHTLIYPGWDVNTLVGPKPANLLVANRDNWFIYSGKDTHQSVYNYQSALKAVIDKFGPAWFNDANQPSKGILGCRNIYPLER